MPGAYNGTSTEDVKQANRAVHVVLKTARLHKHKRPIVAWDVRRGV